MDARDTREMLTGLMSMYPNHPVNEFAEGMWIQAMADIPRDAAMNAAYEWVSTERWFPTVADIKERVQESTTSLPTADEAWRMVMDRIRSTYPGRPAPDWDAPAIVQDALREIGGTWAVRQTAQTSDMEKRFRGAYQERRQRDVRRPVALGDGVKEIAS